MIYVIVVAFLLFIPQKLCGCNYAIEWVNQYPNWMNGVQWGVVVSFIGIIVGVYYAVMYAVRRYEGVDVLDYFHLRSLLKSRWYPLLFQIISFGVFIAIFYYLLFGLPYYSYNPGIILVWTFWWALLPLSFITLGRFWCSVCPFAWITDVVQKYVGKKKRVPKWIVKNSIWIIDFTFLFVSWIDHIVGMTDKPLITGYVFVGLIIAVVLFAWLYERKAFCRYICFLGNIIGLYSMAAPMELTSKNRSVCTSCKDRHCYMGRGKIEGCPYSLTILGKQSNRYCSLCASCIKTCQNDNVALSFRVFGKDFWRNVFVSFDESFFAKLLVGMILVQNIGMLTLWYFIMDFAQDFTGIRSEFWLTTIVFLVVVTLPFLFMFAVSWVSSRVSGESTIRNFARFGYAFVAINLAGHIAHNLMNFFGEGKTILAAFWGLFSGNVYQFQEPWLLQYGTVRMLQYFILLLGTVGTLIVTYKIAENKAKNKRELMLTIIPYYVFAVGLILLNLLLISQPMISRAQGVMGG